MTIIANMCWRVSELQSRQLTALGGSRADRCKHRMLFCQWDTNPCD